MARNLTNKTNNNETSEQNNNSVEEIIDEQQNTEEQEKINKTEQSKTESKPQSTFSDKKCFRCGQRKISKGICQNCGEQYDNLRLSN